MGKVEWKDTTAMSEHTPGPWHWEDCDNYYSKLIGPNGEWVLDDGSAGGEYGAQITPNSPDGWLVAAAPELLAACERALDTLKELYAYQGDDYALGGDVAALDAIIKKAKGLQP